MTGPAGQRGLVALGEVLAPSGVPSWERPKLLAMSRALAGVPVTREEAAAVAWFWQHRLIVQFENRRTNGAADFAGIARAKAEIADMFEAAWHGRKLKSRTRAARHDGVGRHAMAGASEATSPAGSADAARRAAAADDHRALAGMERDGRARAGGPGVPTRGV